MHVRDAIHPGRRDSSVFNEQIVLVIRAPILDVDNSIIIVAVLNLAVPREFNLCMKFMSYFAM